MTFGAALKALKAGERVYREGWNGDNMWLTLIRAGKAHLSRLDGDVQSYDVQDCVGMKTAQDTMQPGWVPSQADMLADDWAIYSKC